MSVKITYSKQAISKSSINLVLFCNDKFNIVDPFLELNSVDVNYNTRKIVTTYIAVCYTMIFYGIYYFRFYYLES